MSTHTPRMTEAMREALARLRDGIDIPARVGARIADHIERELRERVYVQCAPEHPHVHVCRHCGLSDTSESKDAVDAKRYDFMRRFDRFALVHVLLDDDRFDTLDKAVDHAMKESK